jgi:hypothetical protein
MSIRFEARPHPSSHLDFDGHIRGTNLHKTYWSILGQSLCGWERIYGISRLGPSQKLRSLQKSRCIRALSGKNYPRHMYCSDRGWKGASGRKRTCQWYEHQKVPCASRHPLERNRIEQDTSGKPSRCACENISL